MTGEHLLQKLLELSPEQRKLSLTHLHWESNGEGSDFEVESTIDSIYVTDQSIQLG